MQLFCILFMVQKGVMIWGFAILSPILWSQPELESLLKSAAWHSEQSELWLTALQHTCKLSNSPTSVLVLKENGRHMFHEGGCACLLLQLCIVWALWRGKGWCVFALQSTPFITCRAPPTHCSTHPGSCFEERTRSLIVLVVTQPRNICIVWASVHSFTRHLNLFLSVFPIFSTPSSCSSVLLLLRLCLLRLLGVSILPRWGSLIAVFVPAGNSLLRRKMAWDDRLRLGHSDHGGQCQCSYVSADSCNRDSAFSHLE